MLQKTIIYIPGLHDDSFPNNVMVKILPRLWKRYGYTMHIVSLHWNQGKSFEPKLEKILSTIDKLVANKQKVYLFGQSAGGSAALNAFAQRTNKIEKVVNICGRVRKGNHVFPSLELAAKGNPAFRESVLLFEKTNQHQLGRKDREKIMVIKPLFDEVVPASTVFFDGATNKTLPIIEHSIAGITALTLFSGMIRNFLNQS